MSVVGIDFGNYKSVIAVARNRGIDIVTNEVSNRFTPYVGALRTACPGAPPVLTLRRATAGCGGGAAGVRQVHGWVHGDPAVAWRGGQDTGTASSPAHRPANPTQQPPHLPPIVLFCPLLQEVMNLRNTITDIRRMLGRSLDEEDVQTYERPHLLYNVHPTDDGNCGATVRPHEPARCRAGCGSFSGPWTAPWTNI